MPRLMKCEAPLRDLTKVARGTYFVKWESIPDVHALGRLKAETFETPVLTRELRGRSGARGTNNSHINGILQSFNKIETKTIIGTGYH